MRAGCWQCKYMPYVCLHMAPCECANLSSSQTQQKRHPVQPTPSAPGLVQSERPVGRQGSVSNDLVILPDHLLWCGTSEEVKVNKPTNHPAGRQSRSCSTHMVSTQARGAVVSVSVHVHSASTCASSHKRHTHQLQLTAPRTTTKVSRAQQSVPLLCQQHTHFCWC